MSKLKVYIATAITGGDLVENFNRGNDCFHRLLKAGFSPYCTVWSCAATYGEYINGRSIAEISKLPRDTVYNDWIDYCMPWLESSNAVIRLPGYSKGADLEVKRAVDLGIPVFYDEKSLLKWKDNVSAQIADYQKQIDIWQKQMTEYADKLGLPEDDFKGIFNNVKVFSIT